jgi:hypothetical protein
MSTTPVFCLRNGPHFCRPRWQGVFKLHRSENMSSRVRLRFTSTRRASPASCGMEIGLPAAAPTGGCMRLIRPLQAEVKELSRALERKPGLRIVGSAGVRGRASPGTSSSGKRGGSAPASTHPQPDLPGRRGKHLVIGARCGFPLVRPWLRRFGQSSQFFVSPADLFR